MRSPRIERAPDAVLAPPDAARGRRGARGLRGRAGRGRPLRRRHQRRRRRRARARGLRAARLARPDRASRRRGRSGLADRPPRPGAARPRGRGGAQRSGGFTLGHFPQSYRYATIGGFAATRSAGQASSGYGRFDALVTEIELTAPTGALRTLATPHTAAGPALRELVVGSEGVFGVITDVGVRIRPHPEQKRYEGWFAPDFAEGIEIVRALAQGGALPDVVRLSDRDETEVSLAMSGLDGPEATGLETLPAAARPQRGLHADRRLGGRARERRAPPRALPPPAPQGRRRAARRLAGRSWEHGRYEGPHLRDS